MKDITSSLVIIFCYISEFCVRPINAFTKCFELVHLAIIHNSYSIFVLSVWKLLEYLLSADANKQLKVSPRKWSVCFQLLQIKKESFRMEPVFTVHVELDTPIKSIKKERSRLF